MVLIMAKINVTRSSMPPFDEYTNEIRELWDSRWLTNMGVKHKQLETDLKKYLNVQNLTLFTNGHLALENIITAMNFPQGSEIITTPFTFASTTHAIVRCGFTPVFCDINDRDYTIDVGKLEKLITDKTVAIIPVHVYGNICDYQEIDKIAKKHSLKVIYDAAHAFGEIVAGKNVAELGDASMFSFHATKVFHTVEGGAVCYADENLKSTLDELKDFGIYSPEEVIRVGGNAKMTEFHAAMGICNLRHISEYIEGRRAAYDRYNERLTGICGIKLIYPKADVKANYAYYPVLFDGYKYSRDEICDILSRNGINARKYFYPLTNSLSCYDFNADDTPIARHISKNILTLPMYEGLEEADVDRICNIVLGN